MVKFPENLVQLPRYPGYYWDPNAQKMFSCKSGMLRMMKIKPAFGKFPKGYQVSVNGVKKTLTLEYLRMHYPFGTAGVCIQYFPFDSRT